MILRRLAVEGWRCFAGPLELGPLDERINVVHGPNGVGKSTLLGAMIRGLMDNHAARGAEIESLRPDGRDLAPRVTIELEHDGQQLRVFKRFLDSPDSKTSRFEGGRWVPLAEGRMADQQVRDMLDGSIPARGFTSAEHWGLAQVLWAPQGRLHLSELGSSLTGAIRASLGAQMTSPAADRVEKSIADAYSEIYTDTGRVRSGKNAPAIVGLEEQLRKAREARERLRQQLDRFDELSRTIDDLHRQCEDLQRRETILDKELEEAAARAQSYDTLKIQLAQQKEEGKAAEACYRELKNRIETVELAKQNVRELGDQLKKLETDLPRRTEAVERCAKEETEAAAALASVETRREKVAQASRMAEQAAQYHRAKETFDRHEKRLRQAETLQNAVKQILQERGQIIAPDAARWRAIQTAASRRERAEAALHAAMIRVVIEPEGDFEVEITSAERPDVRHASPAEPVELTAAGTVEFRIPGVARFRATGPSESIDSLRAGCETARAELESLLAGFPTRDLGELEELQNRAVDIGDRLIAAQAQLDGLLGGDTLDVLQKQHEQSAAAVERLAAECPDWANAPPDAELLQADARQARQQFDADLEATSRRHRACREANLAADATLRLANSQLDDRRDQLRNTERRLGELLGELNADERLAELKADRDNRALEVQAARANLNRTESALKEFGDDPDEKKRQIERESNELKAELQRKRQQLHDAARDLNQMQDQSPYSALGEVEEEMARIEQSVAVEQLRNDAVRLLYETFRQCRDASVASVVVPVQDRATELLCRITGVPLGAVRFSESFLPEHVVPDGLDGPRELDRLSGGEQEQVHLAVRLALAETLYADQRHLLVLDDVLTATDPNRLARALDLLAEAAERYQILIFTCHPEPYRHLPAARYFDLQAMRQM